MRMKALAACIALALTCVWSAAAQGVDDATAAPPTIRFEYAFYAVPADFPYLWVSAYRVGNLKGRATAAWTTADSSAANGVDYRQSTGELSWADGVGGAQQLYVPLIPRRTGPYDRTFTVLLHDQTGAALSFPSAAVVTITQPSVWQLWADASTAGATAGAGADPFGVPNGSTGSAVTNTPSPSDGAGAVNPASTTPTTPTAGTNPNTTPSAGTGGGTTTAPVIGGGAGSGMGTDPTANAGSGSGSGSGAGSVAGTQMGSGSGSGSGAAPGAGSQPGGGTDPQSNPAGGTGTPAATGDGGATNPPQPSGGSGGGSQPIGSVQTGGSGQQIGTGAGSTTTPGGSGGGEVQPAGGSGTPTTPTQPLSTTGSAQPQSGGGGGGSAASASTGILTQFASAFTWDSAAYQTDNSNNFVVVGVSRLQVLPLGLQPCSVRYSTVDGTGRAGVDYTATSGVLEYGANDFAPRAIFVPIRQGDATSAPAGVKVFAIRLSDPVNAFLGVPSSAPISVSAVPFSEGKVVLTSDAYATPVQAGAAVATVQRLIGSHGAVNVTYGTTDGTAKAGTDYTSTTGTLSWADGDTAPRNISIPLLASAAAAALPGDGTVAGAPNFFLSLALAADSKGFLGGPRTAAMFITNLAPRSGGTGSGSGSGTGAGTTQTNVSGGGGSSTGMGIGTGSGSGTGVKPTASSTGTNKPTASSTGTRAPPVVVPPPSTIGTASASTGTTTNTTTERSGAATVRGFAPAALATVLLSALWLSA